MEHETTVDTLCRDTSDTSDTTATDTTDTSATTSPPDAELVDELLIEEISIDGMCGVY